MTPSGVCSATFAPMAEPASAKITAGIASLILMRPLFAKRAVATTVPMALETLLVPSATCGGRPATRYAVSEMSPPPPAMASTSIARNTSGHTMSSVMGSMDSLPYLYCCNGVETLRIIIHGSKPRELGGRAARKRSKPPNGRKRGFVWATRITRSSELLADWGRRLRRPCSRALSTLPRRKPIRTTSISPF